MDRSASVTILRHPSDRAVSGYFFRGHSPNWDRFGVRKEFPRDMYLQTEKTEPAFHMIHCVDKARIHFYLPTPDNFHRPWHADPALIISIHVSAHR